MSLIGVNTLIAEVMLKSTIYSYTNLIPKFHIIMKLRFSRILETILGLNILETTKVAPSPATYIPVNKVNVESDSKRYTLKSTESRP